MSTNEIKVQEEISNIDFDSAIDKCSSDPEFKKKLLMANVLIIPDGKDSKNNNIFPVTTTELYRYLQKKSPSQVKLDIASKDENYVITTETDGLIVKTVQSEVRGESMEQCFEYTKKLHNGEVKSKNS